MTAPLEINIAAVCEAIAEVHPDRECIRFRDRVHTWAETAARTRRLARLLHDHGIGTRAPFGSGPRWEPVQDTVALYLHNGNEYLEGMLGAWKARAVSANVNYRYVADELRYLFDDMRARAIVVHATFAPLLGEVLPTLAAPPELVLQVADDSGHPLLPGALDYETALAATTDELPSELVAAWSGDDLYLCYTGGTTGRPKGAMWRQADFVVGALGLTAKDGAEHRTLAAVVAAATGTARPVPAPPLMHGAAHWSALSALLNGGTVVIQDHPERFDPDDVLDAIVRHDANAMTIVGDPMARPLVDALRRRPRALPRLRRIISGGAVLSPAVKAELLDLFPGVTIVDVLGSTESGRQAMSSTTAADRGRAPAFDPEPTTALLDEARTRLLDPAGDVGVVGWIARRGRVPLGYLGDEAATRATFPEVAGDRFVVAGDRGRWTDTGRIELLGRDSVCINTGGEKVFAEEVETALKLHPAVFDAVVCGRPSSQWGEEVVAIVQLRPGATADDDAILAEAGAHLARYKLPKRIIRLEQLVRSPSGKADYPWARAVAIEDATADRD